MDKLVRRVTVVQGSGENRHANVVYKADDEDDIDDFEPPILRRIERGVRHYLKSQVVEAQDAYQRHLDSVGKGGGSWIYDIPGNIMKAHRKALKESYKALRLDEEDDERGD